MVVKTSAAKLLLLITLLGCQNYKGKSDLEVKNKFGILTEKQEALEVRLEVDNFQSFDQLYHRIENIVCNDSIPVLTIKVANKLKTVHPYNFCSQTMSVDFKSRNVIKIYNDMIIKNDDIIYPIDSLGFVLARDIRNKGIDSLWSDDPEKLFILLSYKRSGIKKLQITLDKLTSSYKDITGETDIKLIITNIE